MDYKDNDYEGQNLHIAGEESSKHSSILRPFVLPKFDFDDNLHGHLRFDSLVDNEVFLGIPSQDDNQWIEDFSRGSSGIRFCSSSTVSCALPRCNNVWSEATSSESVEMLLKAVGQEETVPGESMVNESDLINQVDSTGQIGENLSQDEKIDDVDGVNLVLPPAEVEQNNSMLNQSANLNSDMRRTSEDDGENHDTVSDSLSEQVPENVPVSSTYIDSVESSYQEHAGMFGNQDKIDNISFMSSSCTSKDIAEGVDEHKKNTVQTVNSEIQRSLEFPPVTESSNEEHIVDEHKENTVQTINLEIQRSLEFPPVTESLNEEHIVDEHKENAVQTVNSETRCSLEFSPVTESLNEEHMVDEHKENTVQTVNSAIQCSLEFPPVTESINEGHVVDVQVEKFGRTSNMPDVEPAIGSECGPAIKQMSEGYSMSHDSSIRFQGEEYTDGLDIKESDNTTKICVDIESKQDSVTQQSDQPESHACDADTCPDSISLEAPLATLEFARPCCPSEQGSRSNIYHADDPGNSLDSSLLDRNKQTCGEDSVSKQADDDLSTPAGSQEGDVNVSAYEKDDKNLPLGTGDMISDDHEKEVGVVEVNLESATGSKSSASAGDYHVMNTEVEDKKLKPSSPEGKELCDCVEKNPPSFDIERNEELEAAKQPNTSSPMQSLEVVAEVSTVTELENNKALDSSGSLVEMSDATMHSEATQELSEKVEHPSSDLIVQKDGSEAAHTEKIVETNIEKGSGTDSSIVSARSSNAEIIESNQPGASSTNVTGPPQGELNKKESLENDIENVGDVLPTNSGVNSLSKQEETFTFDIRPSGGQSTEDSNRSSQQIPRIQTPLTGEGFPSTPGGSQKDIATVKEISKPTSLVPSGGPTSSEGVNGSSDRKPRRRSSKSGKESAKKANLAKETTSSQQGERLDKLSTFSSGKLMTFDGAVKSVGGVSVSTFGLPDLNNTSGPSSSAFFHQHFTDLQQVQLRAQIFVYGSLIQGAAPDEACMISAFDGSRSFWEPSWRACVERRHGKKYEANKPETPLQSRSGAKSTDETSIHGSSQTEILSTPIGRASDKAAASTLSPLVNPIFPLSSPLWNISTPSSAGLPSSSMARFDYHVVSPLHPYPTPPTRNLTAHTTTWPSQAPFPVPWLASSKNSPFDIHANYSSSPITEPVKLTPLKELPHVPAIRTATTTVFTGTPLDLKKITGSTSKTETKTRKRKKSSVATASPIPVTTSQIDTVSTPTVTNHLPKKVLAMENLSQMSFTKNQTDSIPTTSYYSTPVPVPAASFLPKNATNQVFTSALPSVSTANQRSVLRLDKRALDMESFSKVEEAKLQAEQAASLASEAVNHCQGVWSKLDQQKNSGLTIDADAKLASAAVAIAAAASVAKAAAAATKIAFNAAVQAKQMADEAITKHGTLNTTDSGNMTHVSTLAISAAREAARKRVEAASAASRHAENLDAIVKAAELSAEAVSHTGKIVGIGDPFLLSELVRAGPDDYWKVSHATSAPGSEPKDTNLRERPDTGHVPAIQEPSRNTVNDNTIAEENLVPSVKDGGKSLKAQKDKRVSDRAEAVTTVSESVVELRSSSSVPCESNASIKEGSAVEVLKDVGDVKNVWFSATVMSLKDDKAHVCYTELQDEGSERLKEWVSLEAQGGKAPFLRIHHPMTAVKFEGTRKRCRSAVKEHAWSVGDRVDAWVKDCWREGFIAEKNNKDPSTMTVNFPADEETLTVKVWHLRPTLIWSDGQWSEYCRPGDSGTSQGDTPAEKRPKIGSAGIEPKGKGKMARKIGFAEQRKTDEETLPLSANEIAFNIGTTKEENKARTMRSGLQKERPRVVFGAPTPKRKYMEVSKHYVSERPAKTNMSHVAKNATPLGFGSRGSKNNSKPDLKEKQVPESKPKPVRSGKPPVPTRTTLQRKGDSTSSRPNTSDVTSSDRLVKCSSMSNNGNDSGQQNVNEIGSFSNVEETSRGTFVFSSKALPTERRKKAVFKNVQSERLNKGKVPLSSGKLAKTESNEQLTSEASEPRRSNRRIQPTSRLLEGIQSSLTISKFPSSHDKGQRSHRGTPKGNDNRG